MPFIDWRGPMEKVIAEVFIVISLILGTGISVKTLHN